MKIQALAIAAALATGAAFAAAPNDTAKAPGTTVTTKKVTTHHRKVTKTTKTAKTANKQHHVARHTTKHRQSSTAASPAPQTDTSDRGRQSRMDEALAKYRQTHS
jgi:transposase